MHSGKGLRASKGQIVWRSFFAEIVNIWKESGASVPLNVQEHAQGGMQMSISKESVRRHARQNSRKYTRIV